MRVKPIRTVLLYIVLWMTSLVHGTGLDSIYRVSQRTRMVVMLVFVSVLLLELSKFGSKRLSKHEFLIFGGMISVFLASPLLHGQGFAGIHYLYVFCLVYLLSKVMIDDFTMFWIGMAYGVLGFSILFIYDYMKVLSGWNENSVAMVGMHSFLVMLVPLARDYNWKRKLLLLLMTVFFSVLVYPTGSRASILFAFVGILFVIKLLPSELIVETRSRGAFFLYVPLLVALLVLFISNTTLTEILDRWSILQFGKSFFNGRDRLWRFGIQQFLQSPLIGTGEAMSLHNSAMTCLAYTGVIGYLFWVMSLRTILDKSRPYLWDNLVRAGFVMFYILYLQQSVELGFIAETPTLLGYILLGLIMGRVRFLKEQAIYDAS